MPDSQLKNSVGQNQKPSPQADDQQAAAQQTSQQSGSQNSALSGQPADLLEQQIQTIEQKLAQMPASELKTVTAKLEEAEKSMLLQKIDNQLHTMKDAAAQSEAGNTAGQSNATV